MTEHVELFEIGGPPNVSDFTFDAIERLWESMPDLQEIRVTLRRSGTVKVTPVHSAEGELPPEMQALLDGVRKAIEGQKKKRKKS